MKYVSCNRVSPNPYFVVERFGFGFGGKKRTIIEEEFFIFPCSNTITGVSIMTSNAMLPDCNKNFSTREEELPCGVASLFSWLIAT